jgi:hypothetical protein
MSEFTPDTLPEKPEGYTRKLKMHMKFGGKGKGSVFLYSIHDPEGRTMPFTLQTDSRPDGLTGFVLEEREGVMTWKELVAYWPEYLAKKKEATNA